MADRKPLDQTYIAQLLSEFPEWSKSGAELTFKKTFKNFTDAFSFLTKVALVSEKLDHHARIENTYNQVSLALSTHDADGITKVDFDWLKLLYS